MLLSAGSPRGLRACSPSPRSPPQPGRDRTSAYARAGKTKASGSARDGEDRRHGSTSRPLVHPPRGRRLTRAHPLGLPRRDPSRPSSLSIERGRLAAGPRSETPTQSPVCVYGRSGGRPQRARRCYPSEEQVHVSVHHQGAEAAWHVSAPARSPRRTPPPTRRRALGLPDPIRATTRPFASHRRASTQVPAHDRRIPVRGTLIRSVQACAAGQSR